MILTNFALIILGLFLFLIKTLYFTYLFQIKEYRFDRLLSAIGEQNVFSFLYGIELRFPAKKLRNLGILGVCTITGFGASVFLINLPFSDLVYLFLLIPLFSFSLVSLLVGLSQLPVHIYRERIIRRASRKLQTSTAERVAITGSFGKTSVKEFLFELLNPHFSVVKTDKNMNTDVGVALSILKHLKKNTDICIIEMGAYRTGELAKICSFVYPQKVIVTAFGNQHIDLYGSKEQLVAAESEPLSFLGLDGVAYINKDIPEYMQLTASSEFSVVSYSMHTTSADIHAEGITADNTGTRAVIHYKEKSFPIQTRLLGKHTVQNLLPAIAYTMDRGVSKASIQKSIKALEPIPAKLSLHTGHNRSIIINDSSNSNVEGFTEAIRVLQMFPQKKKIIVSKGIIELGKDKHNSYKTLMRTLHSTDITLFTTDSDFTREGKRSVQLFNSEEDLLTKLLSTIDPDTALVLEGRFTEHFIKKIL